MPTKSDSSKGKLTENFYEFSQLSDYSFMNSLNADPQSTQDGRDHKPRSVYSGHYVPVIPTAIPTLFSKSLNAIIIPDLISFLP